MNDAEYERRRRWENRILNAILFLSAWAIVMILFTELLNAPIAGAFAGVYFGYIAVDHQMKMRNHALGT